MDLLKRSLIMYTNTERKKKRSNLLGWFFVLVILVSLSISDVGNVNPALADAGDTAASEVDAAAVIASASDEQAGGEFQTFSFQKDTTIKTALRVLAARYQKNIVPTPNVDGMLGFTTLYNVSFEDAMDAIMGMNLKYEQRGQLIKVYTKDEYQKVMEDKGRMISRVFELYYITAAEAMKLISPVLSSAGSIKGSSPAKNVVPTGSSISAGSGGGDDMALNDMVVILDYPEKVEAAEELLGKLDVRPKQVLIEATILSVTLTEGMRFGVDLNFMAGVSLTGTSASAAVQDTVSGGALTNAVTSQTPVGQIATGGFSGTPLEVSGFATVGSGLRVGVKAGNMSAFITALEQVTDTTILANPKILAVNKQLGQVYIGNKIGYVDQTTQTQTSTTQQVKFLETGTKLSFRPYIGDDGYIRMDIQPKDSSGTLKANDIPDESSTELATNIIVKDGETIVIGGLFRDVVTSSKNQIPLLGDLPIIGSAFRSNTDSTVRQEVIVLLTVHIIEEPGETKGDERVEDISRKRFGAKEGLQWFNRARLAEDAYARAASFYVEGDLEAALEELDKALNIRPTYLEVIRLKERILAETATEDSKPLERILLGDVEREDTEKWLRR
jgi:type IV pilus assembly protein PilQ